MFRINRVGCLVVIIVCSVYRLHAELEAGVRDDGFSIKIIELGPSRFSNKGEDIPKFKGKILSGAIIEVDIERPGVKLDVVSSKIRMSSPNGKQANAFYYFLAGVAQDTI